MDFSLEVKSKIISVLEEEKARHLKFVEEYDAAIAEILNGKAGGATLSTVSSVSQSQKPSTRGSVGWKAKIDNVLSDKIEQAIPAVEILEAICKLEPNLRPVAAKSIGSALSSNSNSPDNINNRYLFTKVNGIKHYYLNKDYNIPEN